MGCGAPCGGAAGFGGLRDLFVRFRERRIGAMFRLWAQEPPGSRNTQSDSLDHWARHCWQCCRQWVGGNDRGYP